MGMTDIVKSKEYKDASVRVDFFLSMLDMADSPDKITRIREEIDSFFMAMQNSRPDLYALFKVDDQALCEKIHRLLFREGMMIN
jgi:hypothetical protein